MASSIGPFGAVRETGSSGSPSAAGSLAPSGAFSSFARRGCTRRSALALAGIGAASLALSGCVNQHPDRASDGADELRLVATSPAAADITDKLELDLVGVCSSSISAIPDRYAAATQVGTAMSPDLEVLKSLDPTYVISPNSLQSDLQPKYAGAGLASIFLNLRSVDGMYKSIEGLGKKFDRQTQASQLIAEYNAFMDDYRDRNQGKESPRCLVLMGLPGSYIVATDNSYVGSLMALAGGTNVYQDTDMEFLNANTEDMKSKEPDIILRCAHALPDQVVQMFNEEFATNDIWRHFKAVEQGRVYDLPYVQFGMSAKFNYPDALETLQPILYGEG